MVGESDESFARSTLPGPRGGWIPTREIARISMLSASLVVSARSARATLYAGVFDAMRRDAAKSRQPPGNRQMETLSLRRRRRVIKANGRNQSEFDRTDKRSHERSTSGSRRASAHRRATLFILLDRGERRPAAAARFIASTVRVHSRAVISN